MKKVIKFAFCITLTVLMIIWQSSCVNMTDSVYSKNKTANAGYLLEKDKNGFYLVFENFSEAEVPGYTNSQVVAGVSFGSVKEFKEAVVNGKLTEEQKEIVASFKRDESNRILTCNFDDLYDAVTPASCPVYSVQWTGQKYTIGVSNGDIGGYIRRLSETEYNKNYQTYYQDLFDNMTITETKELENGKTVIYSHSDVSEMKNIRYTLKQGNKTFIVDESYCLSDKYESTQVNSEVPLSVTMYCTDEDGRYIIDLHGFDSVPTADWLLGFGIEKYTES